MRLRDRSRASGVLRTRPLDAARRESEQSGQVLARVLDPLDLMVLGIGATIGTGIFVLTGVAAATHAGPAVSLSFLLAAVACALAALCYAEFASSVPVAGSAYTYAYTVLGELPAWIIGWDLILELSVAGAAVAIGWSRHLQEIAAALGMPIPQAIAGGAGAVADLPAALVVLVLTGVLILGMELSAQVTRVVTAVKVGIVLFFIVYGARFVDPANWSPFVPPPAPFPSGSGTGSSLLDTPLVQLLFGAGGEPMAFGMAGVISGAAIIFFAYLGFDVVATTAEETRNPQRDMPIGILGSLAVATVLYVLVALVMTGMVSYRELNTAAPMVSALDAVGQSWAAGLVSIGAVAGLTTVIIVLLLGQSRVFFAMSRDGLLPAWLSTVHPRFRTPYRITALTGASIAVIAALTPIGEVAELVNIGTLLAFALVSLSVILHRHLHPDAPRPFRTPLVPGVPLLAALLCSYLMVNLPLITWIRFVAWLLLGLVVYWTYGARHSRLGHA